MTQDEIVKIVTREFPVCSQYNMKHILRKTFELIGDSLEAGEKVTIPKFGQFYIKKKETREYYNPTLKQNVVCESHNQVGFKPSSSLVEKVNE